MTDPNGSDTATTVSPKPWRGSQAAHQLPHPQPPQRGPGRGRARRGT